MPRAKSLTVAQYQALLVGVPKYFATTVFTYAGVNYTAAQLVAFITAILNVKLAVAPAKATWLAATKAVEAADAGDGEIVKGVREMIALMLKSAPSTLAELAIAPRKTPTPMTVEQRAAAKAKAAATRKARGTGGKKQKALITGNVTGVTIIPTTVPAAAPATPSVTVPNVATTGGGIPHA